MGVTVAGEAQMSGLLAFSEIALNFAVAVAAALGLYLAWLGVTAAQRQTEATLLLVKFARLGVDTTGHDDVLWRFNRAVGQLSDAKLLARLGAIYALRQLARESPDLAEATVNLLSTYLRESAERHPGDQLPVDLREIMRVLDQWC